jgi:hypothetical protein
MNEVIWHKCSEVLPECDESGEYPNVLIYYDTESIDDKNFCPYFIAKLKFNRGVAIWNSIYNFNTVSSNHYWSNLPTPPIKKKDNSKYFIEVEY